MKSSSRTFTIITIVVLCTVLQAHRYVYPDLSQLCPTLASYESISTTHSQLHILYGNNFLTYLTSGTAEPISEGTTGRIFAFDGVSDLDGEMGRVEAVKLELVNEDFNSSLGKTQQYRLYKEALTLYYLNKIDNYHLFVPEFYYCLDLGRDFVNLAGKAETPDKQYVQIAQDVIPFVLSTEKLDMTLASWNLKVLEGGIINLSSPERVQLGINLLKGLVMINSKFLHCDVNNTNIMITQIDLDTADVNISHGLKVIEGQTGFYYQVNYVDYGLSEKKSNQNNQTRCKGGTPGFFGYEYFIKHHSHDGLDTFALAVTLINQELSAVNLDYLSDILRVVQNLKRDEKLVFAKEDIVEIQKIGLLKVLVSVMDHNNFQAAVKKRILAVIPQVKNLVEGSSPNLSWEEDDPSDFLYTSIQIFEVFIHQTLYVFTETSYFYTDINPKIKFLENSVLQIDQKITEHEKDNEVKAQEYRVLKADTNDYIHMAKAQKSLKKIYFQNLLEMLKIWEYRPSAKNALVAIMLLLKKYKIDNLERLRKLDMTFLESMSENGEEDEEEDRIYIQRIIDNRKNQFGTIYETGVTQFQRRAMLVI